MATLYVHYDRWSYKVFNRLQALRFALMSVFNAVVAFYVLLDVYSGTPMIIAGSCVGVYVLVVWGACFGIIKTHKGGRDRVDCIVRSLVVFIKLLEISIMSVSLAFLVKEDKFYTDDTWNKVVCVVCIVDITLDSLAVLAMACCCCCGSSDRENGYSSI